jgi:hypothetical protein
MVQPFIIGLYLVKRLQKQNKQIIVNGKAHAIIYAWAFNLCKYYQ